MMKFEKLRFVTPVGGHVGFWPPYWIFRVARQCFVNGYPWAICTPSFMLVSQTERFGQKNGLICSTKAKE